MTNLARRLIDRAERRPDSRVTVGGQSITFAALFQESVGLSAALTGSGLAAGDRVAVVAQNSMSYLRLWMALQLAGATPALINASYPQDLYDQLLESLDPDWVAVDEDLPSRYVERSGRPGIRLGRDGSTTIREQIVGHVDARPETCPGLHRDPSSPAGYMHTSGTTGAPKFLTQSHTYYLALGSYVADVFSLTGDDTVLAPLPLYHINPLGYGWMSTVMSDASFASMTNFSAQRFWDHCRGTGATVAILHVAAVEILKRRCSRADSAGHRLKSVFLADADFARQFDVPTVTSGYGSTEAGGLCSAKVWPIEEIPNLPEGISRAAGIARPGFTLSLTDSHEIVVTVADRDQICSQYLVDGGTRPVADANGEFRTGDLGRCDPQVGLVFVERAADSIRVKGEYVPIMYVEERFRNVEGVVDAAIWHRPGELGEQEVVLYVVAAPGTEAPLDALRRRAQELTAFMRPRQVVQVTEIPRTTGIVKIRRAQLVESERVRSWDVEW